MKKLLLFLAFVPTIIMAQNKSFVINGKITGIPDGDVKINTTQENTTIATGIAKNGEFSINGSIPEPSLYFLVLPNEKPQYIFLENKPIVVTGTKADIKNLKVEGSESHKDFSEFNRIFNP